MKAQPRRIGVMLGITGFGVFLLAGYFAVQITAKVDLVGVELPDAFDAKEARRKLEVLESARKETQVGYVRLSEAEINSHLSKHYDVYDGKGIKTNDRKLVPGQWNLRKARIDLRSENFSFYTWHVYPIGGKSIEVVWERIGHLDRSHKQWRPQIEFTRIGRQSIPAWMLPRVQAVLEPGDEVLKKELDFLAGVPAIELRNNDLTRRTEVRLYTYAETNVIAKASAPR